MDPEDGEVEKDADDEGNYKAAFVVLGGSREKHLIVQRWPAYMDFVRFSTTLLTNHIYQHRRKTAEKSSFRLYELLDGANSKI